MNDLVCNKIGYDVTTYCRSAAYWVRILATDAYKVITTMVIGPLDDRTYCARSAFTHLVLWRKLYNLKGGLLTLGSRS